MRERSSRKDGCWRASGTRTSSPSTASIATTASSACGWSSSTASRWRASSATRGALDPREAALIGIDLCRAVAAVHKAGLVHRDIKAHNVMREGSGRIVLMDFGAGELRTGAVRSRVRRRDAAVSGSRVVRRRACDDCQRRLQHGRAAVPPRHGEISGRRRDAGADRGCAGATGALTISAICGPSFRTASRRSWSGRSTATRPAAIGPATRCSAI